MSAAFEFPAFLQIVCTDTPDTVDLAALTSYITSLGSSSRSRLGTHLVAVEPTALDHLDSLDEAFELVMNAVHARSNKIMKVYGSGPLEYSFGGEASSQTASARTGVSESLLSNPDVSLLQILPVTTPAVAWKLFDNPHRAFPLSILTVSAAEQLQFGVAATTTKSKKAEGKKVIDKKAKDREKSIASEPTTGRTDDTIMEFAKIKGIALHDAKILVTSATAEAQLSEYLASVRNLAQSVEDYYLWATKRTVHSVHGDIKPDGCGVTYSELSNQIADAQLWSIDATMQAAVEATRRNIQKSATFHSAVIEGETGTVAVSPDSHMYAPKESVPKDVLDALVDACVAFREGSLLTLAAELMEKHSNLGPPPPRNEMPIVHYHDAAAIQATESRARNPNSVVLIDLLTPSDVPLNTATRLAAELLTQGSTPPPLTPSQDEPGLPRIPSTISVRDVGTLQLGESDLAGTRTDTMTRDTAMRAATNAQRTFVLAQQHFLKLLRDHTGAPWNTLSIEDFQYTETLTSTVFAQRLQAAMQDSNFDVEVVKGQDYEGNLLLIVLPRMGKDLITTTTSSIKFNGTQNRYSQLRRRVVVHPFEGRPQYQAYQKWTSTVAAAATPTFIRERVAYELAQTAFLRTPDKAPCGCHSVVLDGTLPTLDAHVTIEHGYGGSLTEHSTIRTSGVAFGFRGARARNVRQAKEIPTRFTATFNDSTLVSFSMKFTQITADVTVGDVTANVRSEAPVAEELLLVNDAVTLTRRVTGGEYIDTWCEATEQLQSVFVTETSRVCTRKGVFRLFDNSDIQQTLSFDGTVTTMSKEDKLVTRADGSRYVLKSDSPTTQVPLSPVAVSRAIDVESSCVCVSREDLVQVFTYQRTGTVVAVHTDGTKLGIRKDIGETRCEKEGLPTVEFTFVNAARCAQVVFRDGSVMRLVPGEEISYLRTDDAYVRCDLPFGLVFVETSRLALCNANLAPEHDLAYRKFHKSGPLQQIQSGISGGEGVYSCDLTTRDIRVADFRGVALYISTTRGDVVACDVHDESTAIPSTPCNALFSLLRRRGAFFRRQSQDALAATVSLRSSVQSSLAGPIQGVFVPGRVRPLDQVVAEITADFETLPKFFIIKKDTGVVTELIAPREMKQFLHAIAKAPETNLTRTLISGEPALTQYTLSTTVLVGSGAATDAIDGLIPLTMRPRRTSAVVAPRILLSRSIVRYEPVERGLVASIVQRHIRDGELDRLKLAFTSTLHVNDIRTEDEKEFARTVHERNEGLVERYYQQSVLEGDDLARQASLNDSGLQQQGSVTKGGNSSSVFRSPTKLLRSEERRIIFVDPELLDFGQLIRGFRYTRAITVRNDDTVAALIRVCCRRSQVVQVQAGKGIIAAKGEMTVSVVISVDNTTCNNIEEKVFIEAQGSRHVTQFVVRATAVNATEGTTILPNVRIVCPL